MNERILIVEDTPALREILKDYLESKGYVCDCAATGSEGLALLGEQEYDLVLTDLRLPGADGFEILQATNELQNQIPKIIMTGGGDIKDALHAMHLGAYDFLQKPLRSLDELGVVINRALDHLNLIRLEREHLAEIERMNEKLETEVAERTRELVEANRQLRSLDEMKNNLLANISHELRTPLVSVRGYLELFLTGKLCHIEEEFRGYLGTCLRNTNKLQSLIESLVRYADIARNPPKLSLELVELRGVIKKLVEDFSKLAQTQEVRLEIVLPDDEPFFVVADGARLSDALNKLMENAIKFNRKGGSVTVRLERIGKKNCKVIFKDTGIGIPAEEQEKIFDRFYQVDGGPTRQYGGTGMGLAIARDNLRLMGSEIRISSEVGKGSVFYLAMPLVTPEEYANITR
jgi:signal transduction histidine kinase